MSLIRPSQDGVMKVIVSRNELTQDPRQLLGVNTITALPQTSLAGGGNGDGSCC